MYVPDRGDIIFLSFDPSSGKEIMKRRPSIVISRKVFNAHTGFAVVAPITSKIRKIKLEVVLPRQMKTRGAALIHQMRSVDFHARDAEFVEPSPDIFIKRVSEVAKVIVS
jgi:mRNA-degrading endonuclease toxin of MazEF toxin-antitoxin module